MMAIDFLIFAVLLLSFAINVLALAAFWVTPGLRTTANRFTINLLIINLVGCLILAPTLFLSGDSDSNSESESESESDSGSSVVSDDSVEFYSKSGNHQMIIRHNGQLVEQEGIILRRNVSHADGRTIETIYKCNATYCRELTIDESSETIVITEIEEDSRRRHLDPLAGSDGGDNGDGDGHEQLLLVPVRRVRMRSWAIDMAAALGALAVLLVVGDTWCAVTDPLRYHSRISGLKTWILIALTWVMGILFGVLSAFREIDFGADAALFGKHKRFAVESASASASASAFFSLSSANGVFSIVFACLYFVLIILLPFGFVCGMYWRIISEARSNGLRMRQNGSSPLLQSALNLTHSHNAAAQQYANSLCAHRNSVSSSSSNGGGGGGAGGGSGLQMQIDQHRRGSSSVDMRRDSAAKVLLPPISDDGVSDDVDDVCSQPGQLDGLPRPGLAERHQNIILTLQSASGEIKRNYSARQLPLLGTSSQDLFEAHRLRGIRQVHSSPNLQKSATLQQAVAGGDAYSPHLLGGQLQMPAVHSPRHAFQQHHGPGRPSNSHVQQNVLQIPALHASPKAPSYMSSLRHRLSNASSLFRYREESRAARISILVVIMFLVSYLPYGFLVLLQSRLPAANFGRSTQLAIFMILLANLSSPFIFAYRNKRVRRGAKRLIGLDALCRESDLLRQTSGGGGGGGGSGRAKGARSSASLKRNSSRISTYSMNSGRYLTPQSSLLSSGTASAPSPGVATLNNNNNNVATLALRPNSSFSAIVDLSLAKHSLSVEQPLSLEEVDEEAATPQPPQTPQTAHRPQRPVLQRGITIVDQEPAPAKLSSKYSLFKSFWTSSKNLGCAAAQSCAEGAADAEPTEV